MLVTGGCGFIGSNFIRHQLRIHPEIRITNLDSLTYAGNLENLADLESDPRYRFIRGDISVADDVERAFQGGIDVEIVFLDGVYVRNSQ